MKIKYSLKEQHALLLVYSVLFFYFIFQDAIYSPDTYSYLKAMPQRHPGYVVFLKIFKFLFADFFDFAVVGFQLIFGFLGVHFFMTKVVFKFEIPLEFRMTTFIILLFPFFSPLLIANNICPEGISYPLYLLFVGSSINFLFYTSKSSLLYAVVFYLVLVLTRGQFIITPIILVFIFLMKYRRRVFRKPYIFQFILLICLPFMAILLEKSFHKVKDGLFMTSPYSYVNAATAAFYVSESEDKNDIVNPDYQVVFETCYTSLADHELLMSSAKRDSYSAHYEFFHNHVPEICNQTIHQIGKAYYLEKNGFNQSGSKQDYAQATLDIEIALKTIVPVLITNNFKKWLGLYVANLSNAFYSIFILVLIALVFVVSFVRISLAYNHYYAMLFLLSGLALSNAMLVSFASHSIMRYLFYNFALIFLMILVIYNLIRNGQRN